MNTTDGRCRFQPPPSSPPLPLPLLPPLHSRALDVNVQSLLRIPRHGDVHGGQAPERRLLLALRPPFRTFRRRKQRVPVLDHQAALRELRLDLPGHLQRARAASKGRGEPRRLTSAVKGRKHEHSAPMTRSAGGAAAAEEGPAGCPGLQLQHVRLACFIRSLSQHWLARNSRPTPSRLLLSMSARTSLTAALDGRGMEELRGGRL